MTTGRAIVLPRVAIPVLPADAGDTGQAKAGGTVKITATKSGKAAIANVIATVAAATVAAGSAASQATTVLQPYGDVSIVRYALLALAVVSAAGTLAVALQRARAGATT
jgi:hypothetical protein